VIKTKTITVHFQIITIEMEGSSIFLKKSKNNI